MQWLVVHARQIQYTIQTALLQHSGTNIGAVGNRTLESPVVVMEFRLEGSAFLRLTPVSTSQKRDFFD